jgi:hypothetical protein
MTYREAQAIIKATPYGRPMSEAEAALYFAACSEACYHEELADMAEEYYGARA